MKANYKLSLGWKININLEPKKETKQLKDLTGQKFG